MRSHIRKSSSQTPPRKPKVDARDYQVIVRWSGADDCFLAEVPALSGCMTHGATAEEAVRNGLAAASLWLEDAITHGDPIPKPARSVSGKMTLRMPKALHRRLAESAEREGVSINQWAVTRIASGL